MNLAKIVVDSKIYKLELPTGFAEFVKRLSKMVGSSPLETYDLTYCDTENQTVGIACEDDYEMALEYAARPVRLELKRKSEALSFNENLFRLYHLIEYIVRIDDELDAVSTKIEDVLRDDPELKLGTCFSFSSLKRASEGGAKPSETVEPTPALSKKETLIWQVENFLNLVVFSKLKTFVVDQFRDVENYDPKSSPQGKSNHNSSHSTCGGNNSVIVQTPILPEFKMPPAAEKASVSVSQPKTIPPQKVDVKGELTRLGRVTH